MRKFKQMMSLFLAWVMLAGMMPPVTARASETEPTQPQILETTAPVETEPTETVVEEPETTAPAETVAQEVTVGVPAAAETAPASEPEAEPEGETEPDPETEPEKEELVAEGYTPIWQPRYWYLTEETETWTEDVTVVEPNEDGSYRMYETTQTFSETFYERHEVGSDVMLLSLEEYEDNTYRFTTFADLQELAGRTYDAKTVAIYCGTYPFTIQESITLPQNLQLQFNSEEASMVIPQGVVFANAYGSGAGSIRVHDLTVNGVFQVRDTLWVTGDLAVTGSILVENTTLMMEPGSTVTGSENVTVNGGRTPRWAYSEVLSESELAAAMAAAKADTTGWEYCVEICTNEGDVTLNSSLTVPENVQLNVYGSSGSFIIASGATLTLNAFYSYIGAPVTIDGALVNNCHSVYVWAPLNFNGGYSGPGALRVNKGTFSSWNAGLVGLDASNVAVSSVNAWWVVRDLDDMIRLGTPADVTWNKRVVNTDSGVEIRDAMGHIYWKAVQPDDNNVIVRFYNAETDELDSTWNCSFGGQATDDRSVDAFITLDRDSGSYYFTVTSMPREGSSCFDSLPATSDVWEYTRTGTPMAQCTNLQLDWPVCSWTDPAAADEETTHCIRIYYAPDADSTPTQVESNFGFTGNQTQIYSSLYQRYGAGYYSFQVRAIPDDITQYRVGEWSEMSESFYYDPATFAFDETWITDHIGPGPEGTGIEKFVAINGNSVKLKNDYTIPEGVVIDINGGSVTVPVGKTLTVNAMQMAIYGGGKLVVEEGGTLILNTDILMYAQNGTVDIRGAFVGGEGAEVVNFHQNGAYGGEIHGVPEEYTVLAVQLYGNSADWEAGLAAFEESEGYGWTSLGINGNVTLSRDLTSPTKSNIVLSQNNNLTVAEGCTLRLGERSNISVNQGCTLTNNGTIEFQGPDSGMYVNGTVTNNSTITLMEGQVGQRVNYMLVPESGSFQNSGTVTAKSWTDLCVEGQWTGTEPSNKGGDIYGAALGLTQEEFAAELAAAKKAGQEYTLNKAVTITKSMKLEASMNVGNGGMITVEKGATLTVNQPISLFSGADLRILEGAKLVNNSTIYSTTTRESYGSLSVEGTYVHGEKATLSILQNEGMPTVSGIDRKYQTAYYDSAEEAEVLEAMALEGYGAIQVRTDSLELEENLVIPKNAILIINPTWSDLQNGTQNDWVYLNSNVTVYGELWANAYYNGTPCNLEINGNVDIKAGGKLVVYGNVRNYGQVHVAAEAEYIASGYYGGVWEGNAPSIDLTEQKFREQIEAGQSWVTLNNAIVLTKNLTIPENVRLQIYGSGSLTVPSGVTLTLDSHTAIWGGSLVIQKGGTLKLNSYIDAYKGATVNVQGTVKYGSEWSFVRRSYDGGWLECTINGVSKDHQALSIHFNSGNSDSWLAAADLVENNDYPMAFMMVAGSSVTLPRSMTIPENTLLHVDNNNTTFVIPEGKTLTNQGDIYVWNTNALENYGTIQNQGGIYIYGRLYNYGKMQLNKGTQEDSFCSVLESGTLENTGTVSVNKNAALWVLGDWQGQDPVKNGGQLVMGRYQSNYEGAYLTAGKALTMKIWDNTTGKYLSSKAVTWSLPDAYSAYATMTAKGKLTARKITEQVTVEAIATIKATGEEVVTTVHLYPAVTHLEILDGEDVVNGKTVAVNVSESKRTFQLKVHPLDLDTEELKNGWCTWSISDKKNAYAKDYQIRNGVLTVVSPTGKTGTVTVKATFNAGTKKSVSFKLNFGTFAESVEVLNAETELVSGSSLKLSARVKPLYATKTGVTWSLKDPADKAYVTLSKGKLKAKTVYDSHEVVLVATSKDGKASAEYAITVVPKNPGILILKKDGVNVTKTTVYVDLNTTTALNLTAHTFGVAAEETDVTWKSSSSKVAQVTDGKVAFLKKGTATITATCGDRKATVTLKAAQLASKVTITGAREVASGKSVQLKATLVNATSKKVTWKILQGSAFGKISSGGKFTAAKNITAAQTVIIRATTADGSLKYADYTITVRPIAQGVQIYTERSTAAFTVRSDASWWDRSNTTLTWDLSAQGNTVGLSAFVFPYYEEDSSRSAIQKVNWKSSSAKVAQIRTNADGSVQVKCLKAGTVTITATAADGSGKKVSFKLKIIP